ncbi:hypothetical protein BO94DRAFT_157249 [Aspergillus sclerotioniger CBS 115572]|uniref:Uncharacterized protein n=1 Tax=Aspergillus sclerotioniger CBS 115572 TaxID=1450535 RepID=A0A317W4X8_9EURO|nr:hypothetical protein BO94DRAFT_157249 [Aspergillus sclerotioniger CBS 115572]PWY80347.1 hypothetical protein BO94DRAFT_157249 [Aspergillus sclerotioniger CBS 115572]
MALTASSQESSYIWRSSSDTWGSCAWDTNRRYSMDDEEEVLYDLDEAALAQLPQHLQNNMRQLQLERLRKYHSQEPSPRPVHHSPYAETWFKNMMARLSADQEMSEVHGLRESRHEYQDDVTWSLIQRQWSANRQHDLTTRDLESWHLSDDLFSNHATIAENDTAYSNSSTRICSLHGLGVNGIGVHLSETDTRESRDRQQVAEKVSSQVRKRSLSLITHMRAHMRCRVRKSIQKLSKLLKK